MTEDLGFTLHFSVFRNFQFGSGGPLKTGAISVGPKRRDVKRTGQVHLG